MIFGKVITFVHNKKIKLMANAIVDNFNLREFDVEL